MDEERMGSEKTESATIDNSFNNYAVKQKRQTSTWQKHLKERLNQEESLGFMFNWQGTIHFPSSLVQVY